ncbi:hypothetical protein MRX96_056918 [Rhipicephalus microplus]
MMMAQVSTNAAPAIPHDEEEKSNVPVELPDALRSSSDYGYQLAALLLKWKEGRRLPESTVHELANDVIDFVEAIADHQQMPSDNEPAANLQEICKDQLDQLRTRNHQFINRWRDGNGPSATREKRWRREELEKEKEMRRAERRAERIQERQERRKMHKDKLQLICEALGFKQ